MTALFKIYLMLEAKPTMTGFESHLLSINIIYRAVAPVLFRVPSGGSTVYLGFQSSLITASIPLLFC